MFECVAGERYYNLHNWGTSCSFSLRLSLRAQSALFNKLSVLKIDPTSVKYDDDGHLSGQVATERADVRATSTALLVYVFSVTCHGTHTKVGS